MALEPKPLQAWIEHQEKLLSLARRQLFLVGGPPRSGTTWLQYLLDSHPDVCCRGEGLFMKTLADPLDKLMMQHRRELEEKNKVVFRHSDGYPLPRPEETDYLLGTAVLLALERQCTETDYRAIGEKTPENVFFFPRLKRLFPNAKFICIVRDPRDLLASAWHYFHESKISGDASAAKVTFLRNALPGINAGSHAILELTEQYQSDCIVVTYEHMVEATATVAAELFRFLGVSDSDEIVAAAVARTAFASLTSGRSAGTIEEGSFFRKGVVGGWHSTFAPEMSQMILKELGWSFAAFGWEE